MNSQHDLRIIEKCVKFPMCDYKRTVNFHTRKVSTFTYKLNIFCVNTEFVNRGEPI